MEHIHLPDFIPLSTLWVTHCRQWSLLIERASRTSLYNLLSYLPCNGKLFLIVRKHTKYTVNKLGVKVVGTLLKLGSHRHGNVWWSDSSDSMHQDNQDLAPLSQATLMGTLWGSQASCGNPLTNSLNPSFPQMGRHVASLNYKD